MASIIKADDGVASGQTGIVYTADTTGTLELQATSGVVTMQNITGALGMPVGTTAQRPSSAVQGMTRYNTTTGNTEVYSGTEWKPVGSVYDTLTNSTGYFDLPVGTTAQRPANPVQGMIRFNTTLGYIEWYSTYGWTAISDQPTIILEYLVVAGGGGGGGSFGGGGGAGGLRTSAIGQTSGGGSATESVLSIPPGSTYSVTVGASGAGGANNSQGSKGSASIFGPISTIGGGGGGCQGISTGTNLDGGSGAGPSHNDSVGRRGQGTAGQGYNSGERGPAVSPYPNPGGGGAGELGQTPPNGTTSGRGGNGLQNNITGTSIYYAGGGGGGAGGSSYNSSTATATGGLGGGGAGGATAVSNGGDGQNNTGGGGGGGHFYTESGYRGGNGGSGIVVLKIPDTRTATFSAGLTISLNTAVAGYKIYSVTAGTGTVTFN